jgi:hypothetical protein
MKNEKSGMEDVKGLKKLNLPEYTFRLKKEAGRMFIFDPIRKKYVALNAEEWVRQHFILFLIREKQFPEARMAVEKKVCINSRPQRFDLLIYDRRGEPHTMAEFKAPEVKITQQAFDQIVRYNRVLKVKYIIVSNGLQHYACRMDYENKDYSFLKDVPVYVDE